MVIQVPSIETSRITGGPRGNPSAGVTPGQIPVQRAKTWWNRLAGFAGDRWKLFFGGELHFFWKFFLEVVFWKFFLEVVFWKLFFEVLIWKFFLKFFLEVFFWKFFLEVVF